MTSKRLRPKIHIDAEAWRKHREEIAAEWEEREKDIQALFDQYR